MKSTILACSLALLFLACKQTPKEKEKVKETSTHTNEEVRTIAENYYEERLKIYPFEATAIADNRYNDQLPNDLSEENRTEQRNFFIKYQKELAGIKRADLSDQDQLTYDVLKRDLDISLEGLSFNDHYMPIQQFWGLALTMAQWGSGQSIQPFKTSKDYDNFLGRIAKFSVWADTAIVNMRKGLATGETYPKVLMERVLPQLQAIVVTDPKKNLFYQPITNMPDSFNTEEKKRITDAYSKAITEHVVPTYKKLYDFIKNEYIPKTRTSTGISDIAHGKERYDYWIRYWTTTNLSSDSIYSIGLKEVERIKEEMEKVKEQEGFKGDLKAFFDYVNTDKKFMIFKTDKDVIDGFKAIESKMQPQLSKLFNLVPKTKFEIRQTEKFREKSASAEYNQGAPDGSRPGIFYVPVINAKTFNYTGMETLFLHEAIPGHHYQISIQQENDSLPKFRRFGGNGAYQEGWALYTESLGKELGLYTDPYQYLGHLGDEMHRAIRLVVDVGMHMKGMTREKAIEYMTTNEPISQEGAVAEIERYMAIPGQALSYKIGQLKISELRQKAEKELGSKFNIASFHDQILKDGSLPLDVLESKINRWIESKKSI